MKSTNINWGHKGVSRGSLTKSGFDNFNSIHNYHSDRIYENVGCGFYTLFNKTSNSKALIRRSKETLVIHYQMGV